MDFSTVADDFFVNLNLETALALPKNRETVLHFCEAVQKEFSSMTGFFQRETGEFVLEGDRHSGSYLWMELQPNRLTAGHFNPPDLQQAYRFLRWLLDRSTYFLGVSALDVECVDLMFGFNLDFKGNRDAIVAEALLDGSRFGALMSEQYARPVECQPSFIVAIDEECSLQARLSIETHSNSFQVRTGQYDEEPISVYFTIREYPASGRLLNIKESFPRQCETCEDIACRVIVPQVIRPLSTAIASAR